MIESSRENEPYPAVGTVVLGCPHLQLSPITTHVQFVKIILQEVMKGSQIKNTCMTATTLSYYNSCIRKKINTHFLHMLPHNIQRAFFYFRTHPTDECKGTLSLQVLYFLTSAAWPLYTNSVINTSSPTQGTCAQSPVKFNQEHSVQILALALLCVYAYGMLGFNTTNALISEILTAPICQWVSPSLLSSYIH